MERLFSPCTRHRDALLREGVPSRPLLQELNLDVSLEELLSAERAFTYADLYAIFENEKTVITLSLSLLKVKLFMPRLAPPMIYWRFAMLFFDWQRALCIQ
jgi:hypothetical protein